jgi:hypothetical protein
VLLFKLSRLPLFLKLLAQLVLGLLHLGFAGSDGLFQRSNML